MDGPFPEIDAPIAPFFTNLKIKLGSEFKIDSNSGGSAIDSVESFGDGYVLTWHQGGNILMQIFN